QLSASEAQELAQALVAGEPRARNAPAEAIARESRGNPYFIEELVRFSQSDGQPTTVEVTFDHVIASRVSRLPPLARRLLDVVAVSGVPIDVGVAYRAAGLYRFALNLRVGAPAERAKLEIQLGDALANASRGAEAAEAYLSAAKHAGAAAAIDLHRRAAEQFFISGHLEDARRALD